MSHKTKNIIVKSILLLAVVITIIFGYKWFNCALFRLSEGSPGYTESIKDSKNKGVFIAEYKPSKDFIQLSSELKIKIKGETWVEHSWTQGNCDSPVVIHRSSEYCNYWMWVEISSWDSLLLSDKHYSIEKAEGGGGGFRGVGGREFLLLEYKKIPRDTEKVYLVKGKHTIDSVIFKKY